MIICLGRPRTATCFAFTSLVAKPFRFERHALPVPVRFMFRVLAAACIVLCGPALAQEPSTSGGPHATSTPDKPHGVANPKELTEPVKLVAADIIMDGSMSVCGKLRDSQGKEFWFFLDQGPYAFGESLSKQGLYVGFLSGPIPDSARATFDGWTEIDFCLLLERAIRSEFRWDREIGRLVPTDLNAFDSRSAMESFGRTAARRLLRYAESILRREHSYMDPS